MINGAHIILYSQDAEADRAFLRDVLGAPYVEAGQGWLIFQLPPAELAVHPTERPAMHELYLMCDDVVTTVAELTARGARFSRPISDQGWGLVTFLTLPGGSELGLYQPRHPRAHGKTR
ncbi:catechol 2,3-dioxygenase-like lactoylglutathione lyase family enzyme [Allocatelliglobosispora scoriae]|uniref:Catechol 2,3-dioxygenase-like lactoylglutathione lyase family enzyme n=1 Tax=Allocatelliglobosispora scoriae TaxID=643052 RepID=A0A841BKI8_9ACTN|nr:VOC family protein [Allocatelliglobosispora scoriae]MBB5868155.1 catechol 2,3-dioxygenase-like lactoylglutathione lyase family enzyme [Allocatelliglobosispora scoriae]